jgi:hypothetical protein
MRIHTLIAALLTTSALTLAACGSDPSTGGDPSANRQTQMQDAVLKYTRCMRENGVDMPDPKPGQRGIRLSPPEGVSPSKMRKADEACRKYLAAVKPPEMSEAQQKEFREAALANARCMREHGIDMPDPTFGENGEATVRIGRGSGIDPESAKFKAAQKACESTMPKPPDGDGEGPSTSEESTP